MLILHTIALLERAIDADDEITSADNPIQAICELLQPIGRSIPDPQGGAIMNNARVGVSAKLRAGSRFSEVKPAVQRIHPSSPVSVVPITIADFDFMKCVSAGSHADFFLAKNNKTHEAQAMKVTSYARVRGKEEVQRVLAERNILLNVHLPFIVRFFYSFIGVRNLYLVMEFLQAATSSRCSRTRARSPSATLGSTQHRSSSGCSL
jgi:hypothetical protein